ncbi:hypothetical protein [Pusillimonas sp. ANT_WB101]|uniref:hypothetical protein n=1 Tax=Pusillimonas sp. ANT_WB101 TaxID=2597356 RepID=UPI0011EC0A2A|nr:hypothetical protein [Pusillimonas sp. ANT_WB101]KAA0911502.1 hypothetical protein FQ179_06665 [Pusillimonas sp. ANT_WB101]
MLSNTSMRNKLWLIRMMLACLALLTSSAFSQQAVVLSAGQTALETGQSFLTTYAGRCYAVMPMHVAVEQGGRHNVRREGKQRLFGEAGTATDLADDVAIAPVQGIAEPDCGLSASSIARAVDSQLKRNGIAVLRYVNGDGTIGQLAVSIVDNDGVQLLRVQPTRSSSVIRKGFSGSQLLIDGAVIGMLVSVNARSGVGTVVRQDFLMSKVDAFLRNETATRSERNANASQAREAESNTELPAEAKEIGAQSNAMLEIKAWSNPPTDDAFRAQNLYAQGNDGLWRVAPDEWPLTLDFSLGAKSTVVSGIVLDGRGLPGNELPGRVEILIKPTPVTRTWTSVISVAPAYQDGVATIHFAPRRAQMIRVSIASTTDTADAVSLRRLKVLWQQ